MIKIIVIGRVSTIRKYLIRVKEDLGVNKHVPHLYVGKPEGFYTMSSFSICSAALNDYSDRFDYWESSLYKSFNVVMYCTSRLKSDVQIKDENVDLVDCIFVKRSGSKKLLDATNSISLRKEFCVPLGSLGDKQKFMETKDVSDFEQDNNDESDTANLGYYEDLEEYERRVYGAIQ